MTLRIGAGAAGLDPVTDGSEMPGHLQASVSMQVRRTVLAAATLVKAQYATTSAGSAVFYRRFLYAIPVRVA